MLLNIQRTPTFVHPLSGIHKGIVIATDVNETLKLSRVKCTIEELIEGTESVLPYFFIRKSVMFGGSSNTQFQVIPDIGAEVAIIFPDLDPYFGEVVGYWDNSTIHDTSLDTNYPDTYGLKDSKGNIFKVNKVTGDIEVIHFSGVGLKISGSGITITGGDVIADGISLKHHKHSYTTPQHPSTPGDTGEPE